MTTTISKNLINDEFVLNTGDTMTGTLIVNKTGEGVEVKTTSNTHTFTGYVIDWIDGTNALSLTKNFSADTSSIGNLDNTGTLLGGLIFDSTGDIRTLKSVPPMANDLSIVHKKYVVDNFVNIDGSSIMSGNLIVGDGTTGDSVNVRATTGGGAIYILSRSTGVPAGLLLYDNTIDSIRLLNYDTDGTTPLSVLTLTSDGNVTVTGAAPTTDDQLTRRDYVDTELDNHTLTHQSILAPHDNLLLIPDLTNSNYQIHIAAAAMLLTSTTTGKKHKSIGFDILVDLTTSGANGLDTGSEAASTWYHVWVIYNPTTDTTAAIFSVKSPFDIITPTMPSGYTYMGYAGAYYNDASSNLLLIKQRNNAVEIIDIGVQNLVAGTATTNTFISNCTFPITATFARGVAAVTNLTGGSINGFAKISAPTAYGSDIIGGTILASTLTYGNWRVQTYPTYPGQIYYSVASGLTLDLWTNGWEF